MCEHLALSGFTNDKHTPLIVSVSVCMPYALPGYSMEEGGLAWRGAVPTTGGSTLI